MNRSKWINGDQRHEPGCIYPNSKDLKCTCHTIENETPEARKGLMLLSEKIRQLRGKNEGWDRI